MFIWVMLRSADSFSNKAKHLATFMIKNLGLRNPCEKTRRMATVIIHIASKLDIDPDGCLEHISDMRTIIETKRTVLDGIATMSKFNSNVEEFMRLYPTAYDPEHPAIECPYPVSDILERCRKEVTPARCSNAQLRVHGKRNLATRTINRAPRSLTDQSTIIDAQAEQIQLLRDFMRGRTSNVPQLPAPSDANVSAARRAITIEEIDPDDGKRITRDATIDHVTPDTGSVPGCLQARVLEKETPPNKIADLRAQIKADVAAAKLKKKEDAAKAKGKTGTSKKKAKKKKKAKSNSSTDDDRKTKSSDASSPSDTSVEPKPKTAKAKAKAKSIPKEKAKAKTEARSKRFDALLKRPAAAGRPAFNKKPTSYKGGRIYWSGANQLLRVYARVPAGEEKEKKETIRCDDANKADKERSWAIACALIESDPRA